METTLHLRISGHVQGVGYRATLRSEAVALGLRGWVRNRVDGTVEAVLQGNSEAVEHVLAWSKQGPPGARVLSVSAQSAQGETDRAHTGFHLLPTR
ncbi:MAG: acylphosphatase [Candidatus Parcubacteria bacterium]|nr:acylphosphatase [Burkholderiales bacterium]